MILHIYTNKKEKLDEFNDVDINVIDNVENIGQVIINEQDINYVDGVLIDADSFNMGNKEMAESVELASRLLSADIFIASSENTDAELFSDKVCMTFERERINDIVMKIRERYIRKFNSDKEENVTDPEEIQTEVYDDENLYDEILYNENSEELPENTVSVKDDYDESDNVEETVEENSEDISKKKEDYEIPPDDDIIAIENSISEEAEQIKTKPKSVKPVKSINPVKSMKDIFGNIKLPKISFKSAEKQVIEKPVEKLNAENENVSEEEVIETAVRKEDIKPKEKEKQKQKLKLPDITRSISIGVAGVEKHIGATHTALTLAKYLSEMGYKSCFIAEDGEDIKNIAEYDVRIKKSDGFLKIGKLDIFYGKIDMRRILPYQFSVYDLGVIEGLSEKEFFSKDIRVIVSGCRGHELVKYNEIYKSIAYISGIATLFNFSDVKIRRELKEIYNGTTVGFLEFASDIFEVNPNAETFNSVLEKVLK